MKNEFQQLKSKKLAEMVDQGKFPLKKEYIKVLKELDLKDQVKVYKKVIDITKAVKKAGGLALLVGGIVRDSAMGIISIDYDIERVNRHHNRVLNIIKEEIALLEGPITQWKSRAASLERLRKALDPKLYWED